MVIIIKKKYHNFYIHLMIIFIYFIISNMKILKRSFKKDGEGYIVISPTDDQDLWHLYNLIQVGDCIKMSTLRKIIRQSVTGVKNTEKKRLTLTLCITTISYFSESDRLTISIKGKNCVENDFLQIGQFHTFMVELNQKITIIKQSWGTFQINLLKQLAVQTNDCEVSAVVMDEGIAHICYVKNSMTLLKQKIQKNVSKKSAGEQIHAKSLKKFFEECSKAIKLIDFKRIKCMIIASPGFVAQQFMKYLRESTLDQNDKQFKKQLDKFLVVKSSTGFLQSLNQVLSDSAVLEKLKDTKAIRQTKVLERFYKEMKTSINKVAYGQKDVFECSKQGAIQTLLISDNLFRTKQLAKRKVYNKLVDEVKHKGGQVFIFSSLHQSGVKLNNLTGLAAILRFEVQLEDEGELQIQIQQNKNEQIDVNPNKNLLQKWNNEIGDDEDLDDIM